MAGRNITERLLGLVEDQIEQRERARKDARLLADLEVVSLREALLDANRKVAMLTKAVNDYQGEIARLTAELEMTKGADPVALANEPVLLGGNRRSKRD